jgi:hypothetical protein
MTGKLEAACNESVCQYVKAGVIAERRRRARTLDGARHKIDRLVRVQRVAVDDERGAVGRHGEGDRRSLSIAGTAQRETAQCANLLERHSVLLTHQCVMVATLGRAGADGTKQAGKCREKNV